MLEVPIVEFSKQSCLTDVNAKKLNPETKCTKRYDAFLYGLSAFII